MDAVTFRLDGLEDTIRNFDELSRSTQKSVTRRVLLKAGEPTADLAASLAPRGRGVLAFSMVVSTQLTRRHKSEQRDRASEVEVYIGPAGGQGALFYASHQEFGTIVAPAHPYLRPAWESTRGIVLGKIVEGLNEQVMKAAARAQRKAARLAGG